MAWVSVDECQMMRSIKSKGLVTSPHLYVHTVQLIIVPAHVSGECSVCEEPQMWREDGIGFKFAVRGPIILCSLTLHLCNTAAGHGSVDACELAEHPFATGVQSL